MLLTFLKFLNWNDKALQLDNSIVDIMNATVMIIRYFFIVVKLLMNIVLQNKKFNTTNGRNITGILLEKCCAELRSAQRKMRVKLNL